MNMIKKWTAQDDATLQRMASEGASLQKISEELDRTPMAVLLRTRLLSGLENPNSKRRMNDGYYDQTKTITQVATEYGRRWSKEDGEMLQKRFLEGWNIFQLAEHFNRTPNAIVKQLGKLNSRTEDMEALFDQARFFFGKKRVIRKQSEEQQKQDEEHSPTLAEKRQMANDEMINRYFQIILEFDNEINSLQESLESETDYSIVDGDPNIELEKDLISRNIPESAAFKEAIAHLAAVIDYIDKTQLDARTNMLLDIELLKARRQLFVQMRERRIGLIDTYAQYAKR
jgi:hypothetical protein